MTYFKFGIVTSFVAGLLCQTTIPYTQFRAPLNVSSTNFLSKATDQSGLNRFCNSVTQSTAYSCTLNATLALQVLTIGSTFILVTDTNSLPPVAATLWIDQNGSPAPINEKDGITPAQINKGQPYLIFWDGKVWRVIA